MTEIYFLVVLETRCQHIWFHLRPLSLAGDSHLFTVPSWGLCSCAGTSLVSPSAPISSSYEDTSFQLNDLFKGPISKKKNGHILRYKQLEFNIWILGGHNSGYRSSLRKKAEPTFHPRAIWLQRPFSLDHTLPASKKPSFSAIKENILLNNKKNKWKFFGWFHFKNLCWGSRPSPRKLPRELCQWSPGCESSEGWGKGRGQPLLPLQESPPESNLNRLQLSFSRVGGPNFLGHLLAFS